MSKGKVVLETELFTFISANVLAMAISGILVHSIAVDITVNIRTFHPSHLDVVKTEI